MCDFYDAVHLGGELQGVCLCTATSLFDTKVFPTVVVPAYLSLGLYVHYLFIFLTVLHCRNYHLHLKDEETKPQRQLSDLSEVTELISNRARI